MRHPDVSYLSLQGFHRSSQAGLRVTTGAWRERRLVTDRGWMPSEAWLARSAIAVLQARPAWRSGLPGGGPAVVMSASAGMTTRLVRRVMNRAVDRPSAVSW
jgi:hypothetical protein